MYYICTRDKVSAFCRIDAAANDGRLVHRFKVFELGQIELCQAAIRFDRLEQDRRFPAHVARLALTQLPQHLYSLASFDEWALDPTARHIVIALIPLLL